MKQKYTVSGELAYILAILLLSFGVALTSAADLGLSMVVSPAYILSQKLGFLTFGQSEYVMQALLFLLFCILMGRVKPIYFASFGTCLIYGAVLDLWRWIIPMLNPNVTAPGSFPMAVRILLFLIGMLISSLAIALFFKTYLYPQVYEMFVKYVSDRFSVNRIKFKRCFDGSMLLLAVVMTLCFFQKFVGIGVGTIVLTLFNGIQIGWFDRKLDECCTFTPTFPKLAAIFSVQ